MQVPFATQTFYPNPRERKAWFMNMPGRLINSPVGYIRAKIPGQFDPLFFDIEKVKNRFLIS